MLFIHGTMYQSISVLSIDRFLVKMSVGQRVCWGRCRFQCTQLWNIKCKRNWTPQSVQTHLGEHETSNHICFPNKQQTLLHDFYYNLYSYCGAFNLCVWIVDRLCFIGDIALPAIVNFHTTNAADERHSKRTSGDIEQLNCICLCVVLFMPVHIYLKQLIVYYIFCTSMGDATNVYFMLQIEAIIGQVHVCPRTLISCRVGAMIWVANDVSCLQTSKCKL